MKYKVIFLERVSHDLNEAYNYYEDELPGLGERFLQQVEVAIEYISNNPLHFQIIFSETRKRNLQRFPYGVFYLLEGNTIKITAVIHLMSDPDKWHFTEK